MANDGESVLYNIVLQFPWCNPVRSKTQLNDTGWHSSSQEVESKNLKKKLSHMRRFFTLLTIFCIKILKTVKVFQSQKRIIFMLSHDYYLYKHGLKTNRVAFLYIFFRLWKIYELFQRQFCCAGTNILLTWKFLVWSVRINSDSLWISVL